MSTHSSTHVIAVVKGVVEGDPYQHFGSLLGFDQHLNAAAAAGLVSSELDVTEKGREFYRRHRLAELPGGRANYWDEAVLAAAAAELV